MSYFQDLHAAHIARTRRLSRGVPARKAQPAPVEVAAPEPPPRPTWVEPTREEKLEVLQKHVQSLASERVVLPPPIRLIVHTVAVYYHKKSSEVFASRRTADIVRVRQIAMYLARKITGKGYILIGRGFRRRDHTTVLHACRKIGYLRGVDDQLDADLTELMARLSPPGWVRRPEREAYNFIPAFLPKRAA